MYYYSLDNKIMAVETKPGAQFQFGVPKALFEVRISTNDASFVDVSKERNKGLTFLTDVLRQFNP